MRTVTLTINGRHVVETVDERMHLADFLREKLTLTATHLRCEQGVCGACTLLIDGHPARSCITYAVLCEGADITTLEGLEVDPIITALRSAFMREHGLQCGFCTPAMLVTARDIVLRVPDANDARIRLELSGNLCRCTGYAGIVRAIRHVLDERKAHKLTPRAPKRQRLGPVGARPATACAGPGSIGNATLLLAADVSASPVMPADRPGLGPAKPNITFRQCLIVSQPPAAVWRALSDVARVVPCMPGASLAGPIQGNRVPGRLTIKLGPISATFNGEAFINRDEAARRGTISGGGRDRITQSRVAAELSYTVNRQPAGPGTEVDVDVRALLTGPLAQFSRGGIIEEIVARLGQTFATNLARQMADENLADGGVVTPLRAGSLIGGALVKQLRKWLKRLFGKSA
jgi:aerobic carbon-monoxide dehydrogenase small subunit